MISHPSHEVPGVNFGLGSGDMAAMFKIPHVIKNHLHCPLPPAMIHKALPSRQTRLCPRPVPGYNAQSARDGRIQARAKPVTGRQPCRYPCRLPRRPRPSAPMSTIRAESAGCTASNLHFPNLPWRTRTVSILQEKESTPGFQLDARLHDYPSWGGPRVGSLAANRPSPRGTKLAPAAGLFASRGWKRRKEKIGPGFVGRLSWRGGGSIGLRARRVPPSVLTAPSRRPPFGPWWPLVA
jgi:hypothetical protein